MLCFLAQGYRGVARDCRGHGHSDQTDTGNETYTYAGDVAELASLPDLRNAVRIGHPTRGGEGAGPGEWSGTLQSFSP